MFGALVAVLCGFAAFGAEDSAASNAILRLLNSRASGSPRGYAEAAKEVAVQAEEPNSVVALSKEILLGIANGNTAAPGLPDTPEQTAPPAASGPELVEFSVPIRSERYNLVI